MAAASASLALAACGGGGDSVKTIAQQPTLPSEQPGEREPDCTTTPRPPACPEPELPTSFAGLGAVAKALAYSAIQKAYFGIDSSPIMLQGAHNGIYVDKDGLQITAWKDVPADAKDFVGRGALTKAVKVTPSGSAGNIDYMFDLWTTGVLTGNSIYRIDYPSDDLKTQGVVVSQPLVETQSAVDKGVDKIFSIGKNDYTATNIDLGFDESYRYNVMKDYQILSAEVDTDKDNTKDSTLHAELWTDYSSDTTSDYLVGGFWLLAPKDMSKDYSFGGFVRGEDTEYLSSTYQAFVGEATYKGSLAGIHTSSEEDMTKVSRLLGKVTIDADFGTNSTYPFIKGRAHDLKLDSTPVKGEILIDIDMNAGQNPRSTQRDVAVGNINGINYKGAAGVVFQKKQEDMKPAGVVGIVGGRGGGNSFVATFGAREVEDD